MADDHREATRVVGMVAADHAAESDRAARFPVEALDAMRSTGLLGLLVPTDHGGFGANLSEFADVTMELGRSDTSVALIFAMHCQQVTVIDRYGSPQLRARLLPAIASGELYLASVTTEPGPSSLLLVESEALEQAGSFTIEREAPMVTGGRHADGFLVTMRSAGSVSAAVVDILYADRGQLQVEQTGTWDSSGMRATESVPLRIRGVVPEDQRLGARGDFRTIVAETFAPLAHIGWSAAWLGAAAGACSRTTKSLRRPGGRARGAPSELLLARLADARAGLDVVHALLRHAVAVVEGPDDITAPAVQLLLNALKVHAADACYGVVGGLIELVGLELGYLTQSPLHLERTLRDLRSAALNYGNDRIRVTNGALVLRDTEVRFA